MSISFADSLSGLTSDAAAINVVSENLANLNTTGYKDEQVSFQDLVNQSLSGFGNATAISGSTYAQTAANFTQGTLTTTGGAYDAAIQGGGFFVVTDPSSGQELFTRQGNFQVNSSGDLMTADGKNVQGWNAENGAVDTNGVTSSIVVPTALSSASVATTEFATNFNLDSNAQVGSPQATFSTPVQVYDALGNAHTLTITYTESAANSWNYAVTIPSADVAGGVGATTTLGNGGTLTFDGNGQLLTPAAADGAIQIPITLANGANIGNPPGTLTWNLYDSSGSPTVTQDATASANLSTTQDGSQSGTLTGVDISTNGALIANFTNGTTQTVGQIALASVLNPNTMIQLSGNTFAPTGATATPVIGTPSTGARGSITGGSLETSTVDIATEFTNLLQYERGYQANSKAITTEDEVIQATLALITG